VCVCVLFLALAQLCEYIEDCEFTPLSVRILYLLGSEGPKMPSPSRCIRYIILENSVVRVAAVSALGRFAAQLEKLRPSILVLLSR
jgi:coatomer protein complex subunit gamma